MRGDAQPAGDVPGGCGKGEAESALLVQRACVGRELLWQMRLRELEGIAWPVHNMEGMAWRGAWHKGSIVWRGVWRSRDAYGRGRAGTGEHVVSGKRLQ